jgi:peptidoglycan hydrolase-like protein with peptidoglycan-binding domain
MATGQADLRAAQEALKSQGHEPGPIDGILGPQTRSAVKDFPKAEGRPETGWLDSSTRAKLGV